MQFTVHVPPPSHTTFWSQLDFPVHSMSHVAAKQVTWLQALSAAALPQFTVQLEPAQLTGAPPPRHAVAPQPMRHEVAALQLTPPAQAPFPEQLTAHGTAAGQVTLPGQALFAEQSNVHVPPSQAPPSGQ